MNPTNLVSFHGISASDSSDRIENMGVRENEHLQTVAAQEKKAESAGTQKAFTAW